MRVNPFWPAIESKRRGGPWVLPGVLIALAISTAVLVVVGVVLVILVAVVPS